jgi:hypothetical protein
MSFRHPARGHNGGVSPPTEVGRPNFLPKFRSDRKIRLGSAKLAGSAEILAGHFRRATRSTDPSARPKFPGQCTRSALRKCEFSAGRPYTGYSFGRLVAITGWDGASARNFARSGRRTQPREKVTDRTRTPCTEMSFRHPARGPTGGSVRRPRSVGQTSCQSSGPAGKSDLGRSSWSEARIFWSTIFAARLAPPTHPRDQNSGDSAPGRRCENANFPRDVPIEVTLLANCPRSPDGAVRARRKCRDLVGVPNRAKKSRIAIWHRAPKCRSAILLADTMVGRSHRRPPTAELPAKVPVRPTNSTGSDRNAVTSARILARHFPDNWLAE